MVRTKPPAMTTRVLTAYKRKSRSRTEGRLTRSAESQRLAPSIRLQPPDGTHMDWYHLTVSPRGGVSAMLLDVPAKKMEPIDELYIQSRSTPRASTCPQFSLSGHWAETPYTGPSDDGISYRSSQTVTAQDLTAHVTWPCHKACHVTTLISLVQSNIGNTYKF